MQAAAAGLLWMSCLFACYSTGAGAESGPEVGSVRLRQSAGQQLVYRSGVVDDLQIRTQAERWQLSEEEYRSYLALMRGERGVWSPGLDPVTALGVSADTPAERRRYAELFVTREYERTRKELAFQRAVDAAWARLYGQVPRLTPVAVAKARAKGAAAQRYALVVRADCNDCERVLREQLGVLLADATEGLDIYLAGTDGDDGYLRTWVDARPAVRSAVREGRVTINHGAEFDERLDLPLVYRKNREGAWSER